MDIDAPAQGRRLHIHYAFRIGQARAGVLLPGRVQNDHFQAVRTAAVYRGIKLHSRIQSLVRRITETLARAPSRGHRPWAGNGVDSRSETVNQGSRAHVRHWIQPTALPPCLAPPRPIPRETAESTTSAQTLPT